MNLELLFPTPVAFFDLGFKLTPVEADFLKKQKRKKNTFNESSVNNYLLYEKPLARLKERVEECFRLYATEVMKCDVEPYITQSWLNWTKPGQSHHKHSHANSLYSGVLYIETEDDRDRITFFRDMVNQLEPKYDEFTPWNSASWWLSVKKGQIVIFPSSLTHMVDLIDTKGSKKERVSLAFNTFTKRIGDNMSLTELLT